LASDLQTYLSDNDAALRAGGIAVSSQAAQDILYASSSTALSRLAAGVAGQLLTTQGTGSPPTWETAASGVWTLLGRTAASSGSIAVAITQTVNRILVVFNGIQTDTDDNGLQLQFSVSSSVITAGYTSLNYGAYTEGVSLIFGSGSGLAGIDLDLFGTANNGLGNAAGEELSGYVWVVQGDSNVQYITGVTSYTNANGVMIHDTISGFIDLAGAITHINVVPEAGNLDAGEVAVYEVAIS